MSTTATKRTLADATAEAEAFRALFPETCYERWAIAGSVRRQKPEIGDIEHVVIARDGAAPVLGSMFDDVRVENLLWHRCEELLAAGTIEKHIYTINRQTGTTHEPKWGQIMRGVSYRGMRHEIWTAVPDNWGAILAIRTGPDTFSQELVTRLRDCGLEQDKGFVRYARGERKIFPVRDERAFFAAAHTSWLEPWERKDVKKKWDNTRRA